MSQEQLTELNLELSQQVSSDERMILEYKARFWKQKAWRAEQQRDRAELAKKEAESLTEKYKDIPHERLERLLNEIKEEQLLLLKSSAEKHLGTIGFINFRQLNWVADTLKSIDEKISFWKKVSDNYMQYATVNEEDEPELCED